MKEFWMVVEVYPDIPEAQPTVIGPPCSSFKNACEVASGVYAARCRCPVVVLHSVAIVESDGIPRLRECDAVGEGAGGVSGTSGTTTEEIRRCGVCDKDTKQTVHGSGWQCHECSGFRSRMTGKWQASSGREPDKD